MTDFQESPQFRFDKQNYIIFGVGLLLIILGFFLMAGGKAEGTTVFNAEELYSTTRITVAPILVILGFVVEIFAIMKRPGTENLD